MTWKDELRKLPAPEAPDDLLACILASRAAGVRVVLPEATTATGQVRYVRYVAAIAVLVGFGWLALSTVKPSPVRQAGPSMWSLDGMPLFPVTVLGQEQLVRDVRPRYALITATVPSDVRAGRWTYEARWITDDVFASPQGQRTITRTAASRDGKPVWLMTESTIPDTVLVDQASLRPLRYVRPMRRHLLIQEFGRDSVVERFDGGAPPNERHFLGSAPVPGPAGSPLLVAWSPYSIDALVQALPLSRGWRGSVYSINWLVYSDRVPAFTPLDLRVTGVDRITVPAGTFDCWKVEVTDGADKSIVWVSKDRRWVVMRQRTWSDESGEWRIEARLAAVDTTPPAP